MLTCHPTQVNAPCRNPSQTGRYPIYLARKDGRLSWPSCLDSARPGVEPATFRSRIRRRTTAPPRQPQSAFSYASSREWSRNVVSGWAELIRHGVHGAPLSDVSWMWLSTVLPGCTSRCPPV